MKTGLLSDISTIISGYAFKSKWYGDGSNKVIRIGDLQNGIISDSKVVKINAEKHKISKNFQIKENDIMIRKELETPIVSSLDNLEKNINDADLEIQNTIKQKIEDSSEKNKNTKPVITSQSLYEEFKRRRKGS